ncbi:MAG: sigma-54-dependent Fis family transcriptional regulator, partial [Myxococcales bacterium]|nr:sigma-54-dependent Fis family transcriptional regulator [Myxococcales bacterium]
AIQAKLLRVLQERTVRPVGSAREVGVDVRVVAATHKDLDRLVEEGTFREDLLYRLDVFRLEVPPLRERGGDVLLLAQRYVSAFASQFGREVTGLAPEAAARLLDYPWPGNVRELRNAIERAVVLCEHDVIQVADLPAKISRARARRPATAADAPPPVLLTLEEVERRHITAVLDAVGNHRARAAEVLGIDRKTLYRKLTSYGEKA